MQIDIASLEMLLIVLHHFLLVVIEGILFSFLQEFDNFSEVRAKLAVLDIDEELSVLAFNVSFGFLVAYTPY